MASAVVVRGIYNHSQVSCHLSSALQVLCHSIKPLRCALIYLAKTLSEIKATSSPSTTAQVNNYSSLRTLIAFGRFFDELTTSTTQPDNDSLLSTSDAVDPTSLYDILSQSTRLDPNQVGDAAAAVRIIVALLRQCINELMLCSSTNQPENDITMSSNISNEFGEDHHRSCWDALSKMLERSLWGGTTIQTLIGTRTIHLRNKDGVDPHDQSVVAIQQQRRKAKTKSMACPFPLCSATGKPSPNPSCDAQQYNSFVAALLAATAQPKPMYGYNWDMANEYIEDEVVVPEVLPFTNGVGREVEDDAETKLWETYQTLQFQSVPDHLLFQLQPFVYRNGKMVRLEEEGRRDNMFVPVAFDMPDQIMGSEDSAEDETSMSCRCTRWELSAAVLHIKYQKNDDDDDYHDEEAGGGHYICLINNGHNISQNEDPPISTQAVSWSLVNDDQVTTIKVDCVDDEELAQLICRFPVEKRKDDGMEEICPTLLSYARHCTCRKSNHHQLQRMEEFTTKVSYVATDDRGPDFTSNVADDDVDWSQPAKLVGCRLRIRWAKGKFYGGVVISYDPASDKHRVQYDDGDVREYCLSKKTIEWE